MREFAVLREIETFSTKVMIWARDGGLVTETTAGRTRLLM
jgi:hypothetical protein